MSRNLELPDPIYDALENAASVSGTTPVGWIAAHLPSAHVPPRGAAAKSLADLFSGRIGRFKSGGKPALSEQCGDHFANGLEEKRREGRL